VKPAPRLEGMGLSPIRAMHSGAPAGAIPLGLGEPTWDLPESARRALAAGSGPCGYGPNAGLPGLALALASFYHVQTEEIMIAAGSQGALFALFQAWLGPGDEVLVPDPGFLAYPALARLAGAKPIPYPLGVGGRLEASAFIATLAAHPAAKAAILNSPSNPTGGGAELEAFDAIAAECRKRDMLLVSDEVYRELYLGRQPASLRDASDYGLVLSSTSKAWGGPGLRVGWAVGDPAFLAPARIVHNNMITCAARPAQEAALALIENSARVLPAGRAELRARWEALAAGLKEALGIEAALPAGAFYYWLPLPARMRNETCTDETAFCLRVRDEGKVIVVPGSAFGSRGRGFVRVSYAARPEEIREGIARLASFWRES
jgi:aspartate/methionine/tyrosine aminotransferase